MQEGKQQTMQATCLHAEADQGCHVVTSAKGERVTDGILTVTYDCKPGTATPELALKLQSTLIDALNAIANDIDPKTRLTFRPVAMQWIDDGKDEIVIRVKGDSA